MNSLPLELNRLLLQYMDIRSLDALAAVNAHCKQLVCDVGPLKRGKTNLIMEHKGYGHFHLYEKNGDTMDQLAVLDDDDPDEPMEELEILKGVMHEDDLGVKFRSLCIEDYEIDSFEMPAWVPYETYRAILPLIPALKYDFKMPSIKLMPYFSPNLGDTGGDYKNFIQNFLINKPRSVSIHTLGMNFLNMNDFKLMKAQFHTFDEDCIIEIRNTIGGCFYGLNRQDEVAKPTHIPCLHQAWMNDKGCIMQFKVWYGELGLECDQFTYDV